MLLDLVVLEIVLDPLGCEVLAVIRDEGMRDPIPGYDVVPDELLRCFGSDCPVRSCFHPFGEIVNSHQDITMTIGGCRMYCSDNIDALSREGPWR